MLQLNNIEKVYGKKHVLHHIDLHIEKGICFGLVGPNGAGKSTLLKIIAQIIEANKGSVSLDKRTKIGYIPQEICLEEKLSAKTNVGLFGKIYGLRGEALTNRVKEILELVGLTDRQHEKVMHFSGGMKRRLHIGCGLIHHPELILMDEPTVGVDPQSRQYIFLLLKKLREKGVTIIYASHYMEEVEQLCDAVAFIDDGKIVETNTMNELLQEHATPGVFTKGMSEAPNVHGKVQILKKDGGWLLLTEEPLQLMEEILQQKKQDDFPLDRLELIQPKLTDVFFTLTGSQLRD